MNQNKVILVNGDNSKWYEQAIFIVKKNTPPNKMPIDLVSEAENIITNYMVQHTLQSAAINTQKNNSVSNNTKKIKKTNTFDIFLNIIMLISCLILLIILIAYFY